MNHYEKIAEFKRKYQKGTGVLLIEMYDNIRPVAPGTLGTIDFVDDFPQCHMKWENGSSLALTEIDKFIPFYTDETCFKQESEYGTIRNGMIIPKELVDDALSMGISKIIGRTVKADTSIEGLCSWYVSLEDGSFSEEEYRMIVNKAVEYMNGKIIEGKDRKSLGKMLSAVIFKSLFGKYNIDIRPVDKKNFLIVFP